MNSEFNIEEELKKLPKKPGVYIMHAADDSIIYVGKAVSLRNRVRQYFQNSKGKSPKVARMVEHIDHFEYIVTDSELEALVLESNLIKENRPKYNTMLKDDKAYPYIRMTLGETYPRIQLVRSMKKDSSKYYGPYPTAGAVRDMIDLVQKLFHIRNCDRRLPETEGKERPCLYYHIGECDAPCQGWITPEAYREKVNAAVDFLNGNVKEETARLEEKMRKASEEMKFEEAASYRDLLESIRTIVERQKITAGDGDDRDVVAIAVAKSEAHSEEPDSSAGEEKVTKTGNSSGEEKVTETGNSSGEEKAADVSDQAPGTKVSSGSEDKTEIPTRTEAVVQVFFVRDGKLIGREHFFLTSEDTDDPRELLQSFLMQYYEGTPFIPKELMLEVDVPDHGLLVEYLTKKRGNAVRVKVPQRGLKEKLVELAHENAEMVLSRDRERLVREELRTTGAVREIRELLGITKADRMEAYDISNISGVESVGSMVVFERGKPKRSDYRKFKIKTVTGPNDYASMEEVLTRRFKRAKEGSSGFTALPDLLLMDGGRGQVHIAEKVLRETGYEDIPVAGMVKDDYHRTRGIWYHERELPIDTHSEGFKLVTRIQDEAHRFAIEYHRLLRSKGQVRSVLDDIPGIGETRRKALLRAFGSAEGIREASVDELAHAPSMNRPAAEKVYNFFHKTDDNVVH